eukprot:4328622-Karenia_brevis.AAC.1
MKTGLDKDAARAKKKAARGCRRKAIMCLTAKAAHASPEQRRQWAHELIPRSDDGGNALADAGARAWAAANHPHGGSDDEMFKFLAVDKR